jgi:glycosyltransferase involved in cell wall biosynthesis
VDVEVLLATYNGERYLREQIDSILGQDYNRLRVLARDDGSHDGTVDILTEYETCLPGRFRVLPGGPSSGSAAGNFQILMAASKCQYVCFSDQDDIWLPEKVRMSLRSMDELESKWGTQVPLLVFTDLRVVDDKLTAIDNSFWKRENLKAERIHRFGAVLGQNVVTGCTTMLNRPLVELALRMSSGAYMHDHWVALLASAMGKAMPLHVQTVLYRQHSRNVVGSRRIMRFMPDLFRRFRNRDARLMHGKKTQKQAESFLRTYYAELPGEIVELLRAYLRCGRSRSRLLRTYLSLRYGFLRTGFLQKLVTLADQ